MYCSDSYSINIIIIIIIINFVYVARLKTEFTKTRNIRTRLRRRRKNRKCKNTTSQQVKRIKEKKEISDKEKHHEGREDGDIRTEKKMKSSKNNSEKTQR